MRVSPQVATVLAWLNFANNGDSAGMRTILSPRYVDSLHPKSLGLGELTLEPFLGFLDSRQVSFQLHPPLPENILEAGNKVAIWTNASGATAHGFPWSCEYSIRFTFEGKKLVGALEWLDAIIVADALKNEGIIAAAKNLNTTTCT